MTRKQEKGTEEQDDDEEEARGTHLGRAGRLKLLVVVALPGLPLHRRRRPPGKTRGSRHLHHPHCLCCRRGGQRGLCAKVREKKSKGKPKPLRMLNFFCTASEGAEKILSHSGCHLGMQGTLAATAFEAEAAAAAVAQRREGLLWVPQNNSTVSSAPRVALWRKIAGGLSNDRCV